MRWLRGCETLAGRDNGDEGQGGEREKGKVRVWYVSSCDNRMLEDGISLQVVLYSKWKEH